MKAREGVIQHLNTLLTIELTATNQYFLHAKMCENWGLLGLAWRMREDSISEMRDAEELIERILQLEGVPDLQRLGSVKVGQTVTEQFNLARELQQSTLKALGAAIPQCGAAGDTATQAMLIEMLEGEEGRVGWLEAQIELISQVGPQNYLATQIRKEEG
jgi:bacterioferritin